MTEREWLECDDPRAMLEFLGESASERKLRLYMSGVMRGIVWQELSKLDRDWVELTELHADDDLGPEARDRFGSAMFDEYCSGYVPREFSGEEVSTAFELAVDVASHQGRGREGAILLREIFGNPYRPISLPPIVITWKNATIRHFAATIYRDRSFEQLPLLADALEEAGCTDAQILWHCRGPGPHTRGCWLIDLLTGRS